MPSGEAEVLGDRVTLTKTTRHDSGIYICRADNGFGGAKPVEAVIKLDVQREWKY